MVEEPDLSVEAGHDLARVGNRKRRGLGDVSGLGLLYGGLEGLMLLILDSPVIALGLFDVGKEALIVRAGAERLLEFLRSLGSRLFPAGLEVSCVLVRNRGQEVCRRPSVYVRSDRFNTRQRCTYCLGGHQ